MKMKNWMRNAGFTLVELIVVIAVLGILGAGAAVGYSGYVKKANKAADQQMVAEIVYALELAAISDPSSVPGDATLFLDTTGAQVTGSDSAGMSAALENAYGSNFESQLKLQYGQWGLGSTVTAQAKKLVENDNYAGGLSYTDNVDDLWSEVDAVLTRLADSNTVNNLYGGNAGLMANAAQATLDAAAKKDKNQDAIDNFAAMWCDTANPFSGFGTKYNKDTAEDANVSKIDMSAMLINAAAIKARNYAFANYLLNTTTDAKLRAAAEDMKQKAGDGAALAPNDFMSQWKNRSDANSYFYKLKDDENSKKALWEAIGNYFGGTVTESSAGDSTTYTHTPATGTALKSTQAYRDAMGYYTLMSAVNEAASETSGMDNDTYKKTMAAAVHNTGVLLNDRDILDRIEGGCVAITVRDGSIWVTPQEIYIGGSDVGDGVGKSTVKLNDTVTIKVVKDGSGAPSVGIDGSSVMVLRKDDVGKIVFVFDGMDYSADGVNEICGVIHEQNRDSEHQRYEHHSSTERRSKY